MYKIGDRVRINYPLLSYHNARGTIVAREMAVYSVDMQHYMYRVVFDDPIGTDGIEASWLIKQRLSPITHTCPFNQKL